MYVHAPRELPGHGIDAESFEALAKIAVANLAEQRGLSMVCGPLSTGGTGNSQYNFEIFNAVVRALERRGCELFDQIPYEFGIRRLQHVWREAGNVGYCMPILEVFYAQIFETGVIIEGWFIPGWNSSHGARWERKKFTERGCLIRDLTLEEIKTFLLEDKVSLARAEFMISQFPKE